MARKKLGEILVEAGVLDPAGLRAALVEQRRWGGPLGRILVDMKLVTEKTLVQAISHQLNFPTVDLDNAQVSEDVLALIPAELADHHAIVPFNLEGKFLDVAMSDPTNLGIIDELRIRTQHPTGTAGRRCARPRPQRSLAPHRGRRRGSGTFRAAAQDRARRRGSRPARAQGCLSSLEAQVNRDEDVLRKMLGLLVEKGIATREEILERIK